MLANAYNWSTQETKPKKAMYLRLAYVSNFFSFLKVKQLTKTKNNQKNYKNTRIEKKAEMFS